MYFQRSRLPETLGWYVVDTHWFRDWLEGRTQRDVGCDVSLPITYGVVQGVCRALVQGSILGPILFSLITNIPYFIHYGQLAMYADDAQFLDADIPANADLL